MRNFIIIISSTLTSSYQDISVHTQPVRQYKKMRENVLKNDEICEELQELN